MLIQNQKVLGLQFPAHIGHSKSLNPLCTSQDLRAFTGTDASGAQCRGTWRSPGPWHACRLSPGRKGVPA
jgi:hypothetical protein